MVITVFFLHLLFSLSFGLFFDPALDVQVVDHIVDLNLSQNIIEPQFSLNQALEGSGDYDYVVVALDINSDATLSGSELHITAIPKPTTSSLEFGVDTEIVSGSFTHYKIFSFNSLANTRSTIVVSEIVDRERDDLPEGFSSVLFQDVDYTYHMAMGDIVLYIDPSTLVIGNEIYVCFQVSWSSQLDPVSSVCPVSQYVVSVTTCNWSASQCMLTFPMLSSVDISTAPYLVAYQRTPNKVGDEYFDQITDYAGGQVNAASRNASTIVFDMSANYDFVDNIVGNSESPRSTSLYGPLITDQSGELVAEWVTYNAPDPYTADTPSGALSLRTAIYLGPVGMVSHPILVDNNLDAVACLLPVASTVDTLSTYQDTFSRTQLEGDCSLSGSGDSLSGEFTQVVWDEVSGNVELQLRVPTTITYSQITSASATVTLNAALIQHGLQEHVTTPSSLTFWNPGFFRLAQKSIFQVGETVYVEHSTHANGFYMSVSRVYFSDQSGSGSELELDVASLPNQDSPAQPGRVRFKFVAPVVMNCFDICWLHAQSMLSTTAVGDKKLGGGGRPKSTQSSHALVILDHGGYSASASFLYSSPLLLSLTSALVTARLSL